MAKYGCVVCGWIYDKEMGDDETMDVDDAIDVLEELSDDELGIPAGTLFEDLPEGFECPLCGVGIDQFEKVD